jgi:chromate reductase
MPNILLISGSSRPGNNTSKALAVVHERFLELDVETKLVDARELSLSFPGFPATDDAKRLKEAVLNTGGIVLASPEYHGAFSATTKLIIENLGFPSALKDKPLGLLGVAGGRIGAIKSLEQLRSVCAHVGAIVLPRAISIAGVKSAFDDEGRCTDPETERVLHGLADSMMTFLKDYVCPKYALEALVREDGPAWTAEV